MTDTQETIKEKLQKNLKASDYLNDMDCVWKTKIPKTFRFMLKFMYEAFQSGQFKGTNLLEIGSGATVHAVASASAHFPNIVLSDYVEDNVEQLKRYLSGEINLKQLLDIPAGLEGYGDDIDEGKRVLESRIRKCVKRVTRCDLLTEGILLSKANSPDTAAPFDVIISCLCLEAAPKDFDAYVDNLKRVNKLLRPGGGLIACGFLQGGEWPVKDNVYHHIKIDEKDLVDALVKAGFGNIHLKTIENEDTKDLNYEYDKFYCVSAEKL